MLKYQMRAMFADTNREISKRFLNLFLIFIFLFTNILSYQPAVFASNQLNPSNKGLTKVSPNLKQGFKEITLDYDTSLGVKVTADYSLKDGISPISGNKPVKQLITLDNPTNQDITLTLNINHTISATSFFFDGKEYQVTDQPQAFKAYKGEATISPQAELYDEALKDLPPEEREKLPQITNAPTYKGTSISFKTPDGQTAIYDFSDVADLEHEVIVQKQGDQTVLTLTLQNIRVDANSQTVIDPTYDMATATNYNLRYDGTAAEDYLSFTSLFAGDLDNNDKTDLLVGAIMADNNSRDHSGSLWVIYDSLIDDYSGTGNNIDLTDSSTYNLRYDGAGAGDKMTQGGMPAIAMADLDNNGKQDLLIGAQATDYNERGGSGSLYIFYDSLIDDYTGTGNNIDLADTDNFNLRYDGPTSSDYITYGCLLTADVDNDGKQDILIGAAETDYNGTDSGSLWVIYNTSINHTSETGNTFDLADSSTYNLRYDGAEAGDFFTFGATTVVDLDSNNQNDILVGAPMADNNSRDLSGSFYIIYDTLIDDYSSTGNTIDMGTSSNYNLRYDGATAGDYFAYCALTTADLDNDNRLDVLVGSSLADYNFRADSGSLWIIYNTLINHSSETGITIDLADSSNYNLRYDGATASDFLTFVGAIAVTDLDSDGQNDILVGATYTDNDSCLYSGSLYVIYNTLVDDYSGSGNNIDLAISTNYNLRYDGATEWDFFSFASGVTIADLNNNEKQDILVGTQLASYNSRTFSGSLYIIYNFPHSVSVDSVSSPTNSSPVTLTGSISASNSVANISGVQYQPDSNSISGTWTSCSASDGSFDSTSENFSCSVSGLSDGSHTVYIRAYDANTSYTVQSSYGSVSFAYDATAPTPSSVSASTTPSGATVSWTTNENASSQLEYGLADSYGNNTTETDTSPRVSSHSVSLSNLVPCTTYHYRVRSKDAATNEGVGTDNTFTTTGCTGSASVDSQAASIITTVSGGTVSLLSNNLGITLTIPALFSGSDANFQIKQLDKASVTVSNPPGYSAIGSYTYDLRALSDVSTLVSTFDNVITVNIAYDGSDIIGINEPDLRIFRHSDSSWNQLTDCSINSSSNQISCTTSAFSIFGLFAITGEGVGSYTPPEKECSDYTTETECGDERCYWYNDVCNEGGAVCSDYTSESECSDEGCHWYESACHIGKQEVAEEEEVVEEGITLEDVIAGKVELEDLSIDTLIAFILEFLGAEEEEVAGTTDACTGITFERALQKGMAGDDVKCLQALLNQDEDTRLADDGVGSPGNETEYFGSLTENAVIKFQEKYGEDVLAPWGLTNGTGYVGRTTREKLNEILGR